MRKVLDTKPSMTLLSRSFAAEKDSAIEVNGFQSIFHPSLSEF